MSSEPLPGSPSSLTDWRWLARPPVGERIVVSDPWGKTPLEPTDGGFLAFKADGPGVLDHLWTTKDKAAVALEVDGQQLWRGKLSETKGLFPEPVLFQRGGMSHLLAPIGFRRSLRIVADGPTFPRYFSCRTFPQGTEVFPASADPNGEYARQLKAAAEAWKKPAAEFVAAPVAGTKPHEQEFVLHAGQRVAALSLDGSGEIVHLEFHVNPALTGTLRQVVVEVFYGGAKEPSLRLPITDLVGLPHPWPNGRWDGFSGTLAGGIRYPWYVDKPRFHFPEATFHLNLPMPFARGLRIELVNRAEHIRFVGFARAVVAPLTESDALRAGRLCGTRAMTPLAAASTPQRVMDAPGPGQWVGLGLFTTGGGEFPPAARTSAV
ncbi:MAG: DUF2961 domain-containing protein, partial [Planctomycetes bacterium]|nr:DUF2961 domain-containing protein [Planctomycetota bacterium]